MLAGLGGGDGLLGVQVDGRGDVDGVDVGIVHLPAPVGVPLGGPELLAKSAARSARARLTETSRPPSASRKAGATRLRAMSPQPINPQRTSAMNTTG
ncbi:MAG: hypothetical protein R2724_06805 [Bryobacterales bacterium]